MILLSANPNIGDAVLTLPAVKMAAMHQPVYFWSNCKQLPELFTHPNLMRLDDAPIGTQETKVLAIRTIHNVHPAVMVIGQYWDTPVEQLSADARVSDPWLQADMTRAVPSYDFLLAPHTKDMGLRGWDFFGWAQLVQRLREEYPGCTIGVIGADEDPRIFEPHYVHSHYGRHMQDVMALMARTKRAVITVDSAPSRIAHGLFLPNHVLLCSNVVPLAWGSWPGAHTVYDSPRNFTVEQVLDQIRSIHV